MIRIMYFCERKSSFHPCLRTSVRGGYHEHMVFKIRNIKYVYQCLLKTVI